jgi:hypothetical protein
MRRRLNADAIEPLRRKADHDNLKVLTISEIYRNQTIAETICYRWRQRHGPGQVDTDRRCPERELEVNRLTRLVAELLLDKTMLRLKLRSGFNPRRIPRQRPPRSPLITPTPRIARAGRCPPLHTHRPANAEWLWFPFAG